MWHSDCNYVLFLECVCVLCKIHLVHLHVHSGVAMLSAPKPTTYNAASETLVLATPSSLS